MRRTPSVDHLGSARSHRGVGSSAPRRTHRPATSTWPGQPADRSLRRSPTVAMMESTGVYWKPIFYLLEDAFTCVLANAAQIAQVPGRKTDVKDCVWIAQLLEHGLVRGSVVPPVPIRELRDLTRDRAALIGEHTRETNRLQTGPEDAGIKLASVACAFRLTHPGIRRTGCRSFVKVVGPWLRGTPPVEPQTQGGGRPREPRGPADRRLPRGGAARRSEGSYAAWRVYR
jgi:hypothetical protein